MQFTPALRRALRLLDATPAGLRRVLAPARPVDLLDGPPADGFCFHSIPVLIACLAGPLRLQMRRDRLDLAPGEAAAIPAATWYRAEPHPKQISVGFGWLGDIADLWLSGPDVELSAVLPLEPTRSQIRRCAVAANETARLNAARELLGTVVGEDLESLRCLPPAVERMFVLILRHLHTGPSAADLVRASGLGRSQAYALFTELYGLPPRQALELRRIELAASLLAAGHGVATTATACGWRCRETFSRAWTRHHGTPPRVARRPAAEDTA